MSDWLKCVGPGWANIVHPLIARAELEGVQILQVKEKFGGLRFYTGPANQKFYDAIEEAERQSFQTCEDCGKPGKVRGGGWLRTLCDEHAAKR